MKLRLNISLLVFLYLALVIFNTLLYREGNSITNLYVTFIWSAFFPIAFLGTIGALHSNNISTSNFNDKVSKLIIFQIPTIANESNLNALYRVIDSILAEAPRIFTNYRIDIVTEELAGGLKTLQIKYSNIPQVNLIIVPKEYKTRNNTKYKARANQYSMEYRRNKLENRDDVWIYHLDDDTSVRRDTISALGEFIYRDSGRYHLAQGILSFPFEYSPSNLCRLTDSIRPIDDLTKFYFFTKLMATPLIGLHGEHLIVRSSIEDSIGWDFGPNSITEDAEFALHYSKQYRGSSTFLNGLSYGASPHSLKDLVKQRRRWSKGLIDLVFRSKVPFTFKLPISFMVFNWATGFFQNVLFVFLISVILQGNTSPIAFIFIFIWSFNFAYQLWLYIEGYKLNLKVSTFKIGYLINYAFILPGIFIFSLIESIATLLGLIDFLTRKKGFVVISKPT